MHFTHADPTKPSVHEREITAKAMAPEKKSCSISFLLKASSRTMAAPTLASPPFQKAVETEPAVHEDAPPRLFRCMHYRPPEIQHVDFAAEYPWRIHSHGHSPCLRDACANGSFVADACLLTTTTAGEACDECARLQYNPGLKSVIGTMLQDEQKRGGSRRPRP